MLPSWFEIQTYGGVPEKMPVPPRTDRPAIPRRIPVEAKAWRDQRIGVGKFARVVMDRLSILVAKGECIGLRVVVRRVGEQGQIDANAERHLQVAGRAPVVLGVRSRRYSP